MLFPFTSRWMIRLLCKCWRPYIPAVTKISLFPYLKTITLLLGNVMKQICTYSIETAVHQITCLDSTPAVVTAHVIVLTLPYSINGKCMYAISELHPLLSLQAQWTSLPREHRTRCMRLWLHPTFGHTWSGLWQALSQSLHCTAGKGQLWGGEKRQDKPSVTQYTCLGYKHLPCKTVLQHKSGNNRTHFICNVNINIQQPEWGEGRENWKL